MLDGDCGPVQDIRVTFQLDADTTAASFGLQICGNADGAQAIVIGYNRQPQHLFIDRSAAGPPAPGFVVPHFTPLAPREEALTWRIVLDRYSVEVFADDGRITMTEQIFPPSDGVTLAIFAEAGSVLVTDLVVAALK